MSWAAFERANRADVLAMLGLKDTDVEDEIHETPASGAELGNTGWYVVWLNFFEFISPDKLAQWSKGRRIVGCQVDDENTLSSAAYEFVDGKNVWGIAYIAEHDDIEDGSEHDTLGLLVEGTPPPAFAMLREAVTLQRRTRSETPDLDKAFELPADVAFAVCGFRHDRPDFPWGTPAFTELIDIPPTLKERFDSFMDRLMQTPPD